jgi:hypothetical protein
VGLYLEDLKFGVIHPSILGTYFPVPEVKLRGKMKLEDLKSGYYLAMLLMSWKICF